MFRNILNNVPLNTANNQQCNHKVVEEEGEEQTCNYSTHIPFSNFFQVLKPYVLLTLTFTITKAPKDISTDHTTSNPRPKKGKLPPQITYIPCMLGKMLVYMLIHTFWSVNFSFL